MNAIFNISEMAKQIGMTAGDKKNYYNLNIPGEWISVLGEANYKMVVTRVRITEAKNGHTTLKVYGGWTDERCADWYKGEVDFAWSNLTPETLEAIKAAVKTA